MKYVVVDLEMNRIRKKSERCAMEIMEMGAMMLDDKLQELSSFRTHVRPEHNDRIVDKTEVLTGITTEMVKNAFTFTESALFKH